MKSNSDIHSYMEKLLQEALKWTAKLNGSYHTESVIMCGLERMLPFFRVTIEEGAIIAAGAVVAKRCQGI